MRQDLTFGAWLRQQRKDRDLTQEALAEWIGCSVEMIRKLEGGTARPSRHLAEVLVARLEVPLADRPTLVQWARQAAPSPPAAGGPLPLLPTGTVTFLFT